MRWKMIRLATFIAKTGWQMELNCCKVLQKHLFKSLAYARIYREYNTHRTRVEALFLCFVFPSCHFFLKDRFVYLSKKKKTHPKTPKQKKTLSRVLVLSMK